VKSNVQVKALPQRRVLLLSCVGGGPMVRLARRLTELGWATEVVAGATPETWRGRMASGPLGRVSARTEAFLKYPLQALWTALARGADTLIPTTNPFFLPLLLVLTRPIHGRRVVPLIYDLYPDALEAEGISRKSGLLSRLGEAANRYLFRKADGVVFIGEGMGRYARNRYGEPSRWLVAETGADAAEFETSAGAIADDDERALDVWCRGKTLIAYVGNMGLVHDWDTLAQAVPRLIESTLKPLGILIAASGPGVRRLADAWAGLPAQAIRFEGPLDDQRWARLLPRVHVSVVTLRSSARHTSVPSKAFSAMAAGNAILAIAPTDSDLATLVMSHGAGVVIAPGDAEKAASALLGLVTDAQQLAAMRAKAAAAARTAYDMPELASRWANFLSTLPRPPSDLAKRLIDVLGSILSLLLAGPLLLVAGLAIGVTMGRPILFRQERAGLAGARFTLLKFRTMRTQRSGEEGADADGARLTRIGRFLRVTSIDELPALWNVLRGEMSLVGPRPLLMRYMARYSQEQRRRQNVKPGITGWAQINGRNALSWEQKFELDVWYVDHRSTWLDLRILAGTVVKVLRREGVNSPDHATMPEFLGSQDREGP